MAEWEYQVNDPTIAALSVDLSESDTALLVRLADDASHQFRNMCHRDDVPDEAEPLIRKMVAIAYNRRGSEGVTGESFAGVSQSFSPDIPADVRRELYAFRKTP